MRLPRQAVVEVRNPRNRVQGAPRLWHKRVLHACTIGSRMQWYPEFVEGRRQDQASSESCDTVAPQFPYRQQTLVWRFLCVQSWRTLLAVAFGTGSPPFRKVRKTA